MLVDSLIEELRCRGPAEAEIVKKYKFQKVNGLRIEGAAESEVNEVLKTAVMQVIGGCSEELVNEVVLPAVLGAEK